MCVSSRTWRFGLLELTAPFSVAISQRQGMAGAAGQSSTQSRTLLAVRPSRWEGYGEGIGQKRGRREGEKKNSNQCC